MILAVYRIKFLWLAVHFEIIVEERSRKYIQVAEVNIRFELRVQIPEQVGRYKIIRKCNPFNMVIPYKLCSTHWIMQHADMHPVPVTRQCVFIIDITYYQHIKSQSQN